MGCLGKKDGYSNENVTWKMNMLLQTLLHLFHFIQFVNVGKFFCNWILKDCIEDEEKKKTVIVLHSRPSQNVRFGSFML